MSSTTNTLRGLGKLLNPSGFLAHVFAANDFNGPFQKQINMLILSLPCDFTPDVRISNNPFELKKNAQILKFPLYSLLEYLPEN